MVCNCDWLSFSFRNDSVQHWMLPHGVSAEVCGGTNIYKYRCVYRYKGSTLFTVLGNPHSSVIRKDLLLIEVGNRWLYEDVPWRDWLFLMFPQGQFHAMSRYDVAVDWQPSPNEFAVIEGLCKDTHYVQGKRMGVDFYDYDLNGKRVPRSMSFGSIESEVKWKVYNKTKEIAAGTRECSKPYIARTWLKNGMSVHNVWRVEVSFHPSRLEDADGWSIDYNNCTDVSSMLKVFSQLYTARFTVRKRGHSRRANDEVTPLLSIPTDAKRQRRLKAVPMLDQVTPKRILNHMVGDLVACGGCLEDDLKSQYLTTIGSLVKTYRLEKYLADKYGVELLGDSGVLDTIDPRKVLRG